MKINLYSGGKLLRETIGVQHGDRVKYSLAISCDGKIVSDKTVDFEIEIEDTNMPDAANIELVMHYTPETQCKTPGTT